MRCDAIVLLGFGGPTSPEEIRPFLDRVLEGRRIPEARYESVVGHYLHLGGRSPYNELTQRQADALVRVLRKRGIETPVAVAYRNTPPFIDDAAARLASEGARNILAIALAPHQSPASTEKYERAFAQALERAGAAPDVRFVPPFFEHPLFIDAYAARVRDALARLERKDFEGVELIFTAHSIPTPIADASPYVAQFRRTAELVAEKSGATQFSIAYQSRSGNPSDPWLEPDVADLLRALPSRNVRAAVVAPIGFLSDHVEILYDLDVDAQQAARESGVRMERATAVNDHPLFIEMLADLVTAQARTARV
jgi:protoporphyrin/coproporphyrin ferrochelatase